MIYRKYAAAGVAVLIGLASLGGCSLAQQAGSSRDEAKTVTIMTHDSFALSDEAKAEFEKISGYKLVTTAPGDAGTVLNQLLLAEGKSAADGFFGIDNFSASKLLESQALASADGAESRAWGEDGEAAKLADSVVFGENKRALVPVDRGDVCMNIDNNWFKEKNISAPQNFEDLLKPEYKDLTAVTNPAASSPGYAMLVGTASVYGDKWKDYWTKLFANGVKIENSWSDVYYSDFTAGNEDGTGDRPIVLSYASSPAEAEGATSSLDATCVRQIEYAGVLAGAKNPEGAKAFISFMLSKAVQAEIPEQMYMYPEREGVELPEKWAQYAKLTENPIEVDAQAADENRETWIKEWTALFEAHTS